MPAVSTIAPVVSVNSINNALTSTLGVRDSEISSRGVPPCSAVMAATVAASADESLGGSDDDDDDIDSESHEVGLMPRLRRKKVNRGYGFNYVLLFRSGGFSCKGYFVV